jgi:hypothetical protein
LINSELLAVVARIMEKICPKLQYTMKDTIPTRRLC